MSAPSLPASTAALSCIEASQRPVGIIGTGNVGSALLAQLEVMDRLPFRICGLARSQRMLLAEQEESAEVLRARLARSGQATDLDAFTEHLGRQGPGATILDLTASTEVAECHAEWLAAGFAVVTANKKAVAADANTYARLRADIENARYCHSTTVGAGLPLLETLQRLRNAGDSVLSIRGLFSGTLTFLAHGLGQGKPFSECVREAREQGLTEPDVREDLRGSDVARKLVIAARAAGFHLEMDDIDVRSLVPRELEPVTASAFLDHGATLDDHWQEIASGQDKAGAQPRYIGEIHADGHARVGLQWLPAVHPLVQVGATDNAFEIRTHAYRDTPIIIRGPGAGARVTALQVLADLSRMARPSA